MNIVFFTHPPFIPSQSMPRYANWLVAGMKARGHEVQVWQPKPVCHRLPVPKPLKKWMGYIDQYVRFPLWVKKQLKKDQPNTLFVFTDHALGPWVRHAAHCPHVIHCHDFLAQRSASGEIPENPTGLTGKIYQAYIRQGYRKGKNFISISKKTRMDLHRFLASEPDVSEVVYNGLTRKFRPATDRTPVRDALANKFNLDLSSGFLLHVGGNQWYKNRSGVIEIYSAWRRLYHIPLPLIFIGAQPDRQLNTMHRQSAYQQDIFFLTGVNDSHVQDFYAAASAFLFPSLAEGFGWPIIEAMASGCPVMTTNEAPMNEVGGAAAVYIDKKPMEGNTKRQQWADAAAHALADLLHMPNRMAVVDRGLQNVRRFDADQALDSIENIYKRILENGNSHENTARHQ
ncbi:glycosyltransferase [Parapedobacter deserti]|uniref:Glycosyltransferase n=1 Tax=Parapedobacter deserti TaxID=1912957 RepID=A0ABV7JS87_9SPHI